MKPTFVNNLWIFPRLQSHFGLNRDNHKRRSMTMIISVADGRGGLGSTINVP